MSEADVERLVDSGSTEEKKRGPSKSWLLGPLWVASLIATFAAAKWHSAGQKLQNAEVGWSTMLDNTGSNTKANSFYESYGELFEKAYYIDLTHAFSPSGPIWPGFGPASVKDAVAGDDMEGFVKKGEAFTWAKHGFQATAYTLTTDQYGTQLDPPAHWNEFGATISDLPATFTLRPLVVVNIVPKVNKDFGYSACVQDVKDWEAKYGTIPVGSVVFFRSDWSKNWEKYQREGLPAKFPGVSLQALRFLHEDRQILFHGHEPLDTDDSANLGSEAWVMHNNYAQAEGVADLEGVPEHGCLVSIGFAKPEGGLGGFARFVAICPPGSTDRGQTIADAPGAPLPPQEYPLRRDSRGVMVPTEAATPTEYCKISSSAGCDKNGAPVWKTLK